MTTRLEAKEEIHTLARVLIDQAWSKVFQEACPDSRKFRDGLEQADIPNGGFYAIVSVQTVDIPEPRLGVGVISVGDATAASYRHVGQVMVKICAAKAEPDGHYKADTICEKLQLLFNERRSTSATSSLIFSRAIVRDNLQQSGQWYQVYMVSDWECEEVRRVATG
jgi:hypothetical protein